MKGSMTAEEKSKQNISISSYFNKHYKKYSMFRLLKSDWRYLNLNSYLYIKLKWIYSHFKHWRSKYDNLYLLLISKFKPNKRIFLAFNYMFKFKGNLRLI